MERERHGREFKLEAVKLVRDRGVSVAQAARDLDIHANPNRCWMDLQWQVSASRIDPLG